MSGVGTLPYGSFDANGNYTGPSITEDQIKAWILSGQAFNASTGAQTAPANGTYGISLFNPSTSGKNVYIYSLKFSNSGGYADAAIRKTTSDPALGSACTISNLSFGGPASAIASSISYAATSVSAVGTVFDDEMTPQATQTEYLLNNSGIWLPKSSNFGIAIYMFIASAAVWTGDIKYVEI